MKTLPINQAKDSLSAVIDNVNETRQPIAITRHGKTAAILMSPEDVEMLMDTLAWLAGPEHAEEMAESREAIDRGHTSSIAEVRAGLAGRQ
jgi:prevent-host-death family protein